MFKLTESAISRTELSKELSSDKAGALVSFEGRVRDHNEGKKVDSLEYQVYATLAQKEGEKIILEAKEKFNIHDAQAVHRYGHLKLGEIAVWVGAISAHRDDAYKASRYIIDEIKHRLPVWKKEHYTDFEPKWVFCKDHHNHVHFSENEYYQKQKTVVDQEKLKSSKVLVIGAGGLGCPVLLSLASAGVGRIGIMDFDKISISNIHRQYLYAPNDVGEKKVTIAKKRLQDLNPFIEVAAHHGRFDVSSSNIFSDYELVLDCTDNLATKYLLHDMCFAHKTPLISASVFKFEGQIRSYDPKNSKGCLRCANDATPEDSLLGNCNDHGVLSTVVGAIGSLQASEALAFITDGKNSSLEKTIFFNLKTMELRKILNMQRPGCPTCKGDIVLKNEDRELSLEEAQKMRAKLLDIRELSDEEALSQLTANGTYALYCHKGIRSLLIANRAREMGHKNVYSLKGGACSL